MKKIAIIGSGVVGKATGFGLKEYGFDVTFFDIDEKVIKNLRTEGHDARLPGTINQTYIDIAMFCVSTPSRSDGSVNLDYLTAAITDYGKKLETIVARCKGTQHLIVIRSTVPPFTTEQVFIPILEKHSGLKAGKDFGICMQPEFLRAKSSKQDFANPWATVIGELDRDSGKQLQEIYEGFGGEIFRVSLSSAESIKYAHNLINACKISFANEMWMCLERFGVNSEEIMTIVSKTAESCWNPEYGMRPGRPYGGTCLPKDTKGFLDWARQSSIKMPMLEAIISINDLMEELARQGVVPSAQIEGANWKPSPAIRQE